MARPPVERTVGGVPRATLFKPAGVPARELEQLQLGVDELEAIRLVDLEGLSHERAAAVMRVSRQTVGRVLEVGRAKVAEALIAGKAILIGGGQYRVQQRKLCCRSCHTAWTSSPGDEPAPSCPSCGSRDVVTCWNPNGGCDQDPGCVAGPQEGRPSVGTGEGPGTGSLDVRPGRRSGPVGSPRSAQSDATPSVQPTEERESS
jgi:uncharacterized protein